LSEFGDALEGQDQVELRDPLRGRDRASFEMHLEAAIVQNRDALGGRVRASLEMQLQAMIEQDWGSTWRRARC
jgi:hypothetical protein